MDSNLVDRVNVDAYCPKIRKKRQNVSLPRRLPEAKCLGDGNYYLPIAQTIRGPISTALNRGRLVTSIRHDTTTSEPIQTRWAPNVGGKTHLIQARPKDMCIFLHFPIHTRRAAKQTLLVRN